MAIQEFAGAIYEVDTSARYALGTEVRVGADAAAARTLYVTLSTGVVKGGPQTAVGGTDIEVQILANCGDQIWRYVEADADLSRGEVVVRKDDAITDLGVVGDAAARVTDILGVAQHEIPNGSFGWILRRGAGRLTGTYAVNLALTPAASGAAAASTEGADDVFARALVADTMAFIDARG